MKHYYKSRDSKQPEQNNAPFVVCGKIFHPILPLQLNRNNPPVKLAELTINTNKISRSHILLSFSGFITSILRKERFVELVFRLVRKCDHSTAEVLREWPFRRVFPMDINVKEPVVYADCLDTEHGENCTYIFELVKVNISDQSSYDITQKIMTAQVFEEGR